MTYYKYHGILFSSRLCWTAVYISSPTVSNSRPEVSYSKNTVSFRDLQSDFEVLARLAAHRRGHPIKVAPR